MPIVSSRLELCFRPVSCIGVLLVKPFDQQHVFPRDMGQMHRRNVKLGLGGKPILRMARRRLHKFNLPILEARVIAGSFDLCIKRP